MAWPPLDHSTHLWLTRNVAAPALRVTADDLAQVSGAAPLAAALLRAADSLASAPPDGAQDRAREAGRGLVGLSGDLTPWGKQLYRAAVRLLVAAAHGPGDELHAEEDHQAWRWAARTTQRAETPGSEVDRMAVMLVAGTTIEHGLSYGTPTD